MALKSIKDKISSITGGETLGQTEVENEQPKSRISKPRKPKIKKKSNPQKAKNKKDEKVNTLVDNKGNKEKAVEPEEKVVQSEEVDEVEDAEFIQGAVEGYKDVLNILGVKEHLQIEVDFTSDQLDYVEFTQTQPIGFDFDEVTDFISRAKYTIHKLETALEQRDRDIVKVASEVKKVEQKMIERNQEKELEKMIGGQTEEERLIEDNMELKVEINELRRKLKANNEDSDVVRKLKEEIEVLKSDNELLRLGIKSDNDKENTKAGNKKQLGKDKKSGLPDLDGESKSNEPKKKDQKENSDDLFSNMLKDIGGLYDDEQ